MSRWSQAPPGHTVVLNGEAALLDEAHGRLHCLERYSAFVGDLRFIGRTIGIGAAP